MLRQIVYRIASHDAALLRGETTDRSVQRRFFLDGQVIPHFFIRRRLSSILFIIAACLLSVSLCACGGGKVDMVETPAGMNMQRGRNYKEVIEDFEDKGFTNIRTETIEDLEVGWTVKNEEVEEIIVGGDRKYDSGVLVPADTEVVIRYHTYNMRNYLEEQQSGEEQQNTEQTGTGNNQNNTTGQGGSPNTQNNTSGQGGSPDTTNSTSGQNKEASPQNSEKSSNSSADKQQGTTSKTAAPSDK